MEQQVLHPYAFLTIRAILTSHLSPFEQPASYLPL